MSFALVYENFADQGVLLGGAWNAGLPLANLQDQDIGVIARSASAAASDTKISVNLGAPQPVGAVVLGPTNLTPGATYRVRAYIDGALSDLSYDSGLVLIEGNATDWTNVNDWLEWENPYFWSGILPTDAAELPLYVAHLIPAAQAGAALAQFWTIEIDNGDNQDGAVSIGRLLMGRCYRPSMNYAYEGNDFGIERLTDITESLGGSRTYFDRGLYRTFRASWPMLPEAEVFDDWVRLSLRGGLSRQVFVVPEENDAEEELRKRAFLATMQATPRIAQALFQRAATSIDLREVL